MKISLSQRFLLIWKACDGPRLISEYSFHPVRKWRFDFAHVETKTAIEIHGATWSGGRHVRGKGFANDREKMNTAQLVGWQVYELTTELINSDALRPIIRKILSKQKPATNDLCF
jgi:very-short-patch-repair endonuclease